MNRQILAVILLFGTLLVYPQTCNDGIRNGFEVDIDCGGVCSPCQTGLTEGQMITVEDNMGYAYRHAVWLPPGYDQSNSYRKLPLIVFFHGNGGNQINLMQSLPTVSHYYMHGALYHNHIT